MKDFYRRHLPHYQPPDCIFSVTFRLAGSLPQSVIRALREEQEVSEKHSAAVHDSKEKRARLRQCRETCEHKFDEALDANNGEPRWLYRKEIALLVVEALAYGNGSTHDLLAHCIMPNHVHLVMGMGTWASAFGMAEWGIEPPHPCLQREKGLTDILTGIKKHTALQANRILGRSGPFWQDESYDDMIRNAEELLHAVRYTLMNPVRAGLCETWKDWPWTFCAPWLRKLV